MHGKLVSGGGRGIGEGDETTSGVPDHGGNDMVALWEGGDGRSLDDVGRRKRC